MQPDQHQNHNRNHIDVELIRAGTIVASFAVRSVRPNAGPAGGLSRRRRLWQIRLNETETRNKNRNETEDPAEPRAAQQRPGRHRRPED